MGHEPPSKTVPLVALNGVMPPSGQVKTSAPLSVVKMTMVLSSPRHAPHRDLRSCGLGTDVGIRDLACRSTAKAAGGGAKEARSAGQTQPGSAACTGPIRGQAKHSRHHGR